MFLALGGVVAMMAAITAGWYLGGPSADVSAVAVDVESLDPDGPDTITLDTDRRQGHYVLRALVVGPNKAPQSVSFIVDTGASGIVLPESMIAKLGFDSLDLGTMQMQTVNGRIEARRGILQSIELGGPNDREVIKRISVVFIADELTGGLSLLGMNVLGRYNVTFNDQDQIVLTRRH